MKIKTYILAVVIFIGIASCGKKKSPVTGPDKEPEIPEISSVLLSDSTSFLPGEILTIAVTGTQLTENEYEAIISESVSLSLYRDTDNDSTENLMFIVPEVEFGETELVFEIEEQEQSIPLVIKEYEIIEDPLTYANDQIDGYLAELEKIQTESQSEQLQSYINRTLEDLNKAKQDLVTLPDAELSVIARIISTNANLIRNSSFKKATIQTDLTCSDEAALNQLKNDLLLSITLTVGSAGVLASITAGHYLWVGTPISATAVAVAAAAGAGAYIYYGNSWKENYSAILNCSFDMNVRALDFSTERTKSKNTNTLTYEHGESVSGKIVAEFEVSEEIQKETLKLRSLFASIAELSSELIDPAWIELANRAFIFEGEDDGAGIEVTVSNETVNIVDLTVADSVISFSLEYKSRQFIDESEFDLEFNKEQYEAPLIISAVLTPPLPTVQSEFRTINGGESFTDTLQADFARLFRITTQPQFGEVVLLDSLKGIFEYTPALFQKEADEFQFEALNSVGTSQIATYSIDLQTVELSFGAPNTIHSGENGVAWFIYPADLDGDGDVDIIGNLSGLTNQSGQILDRNSPLVWYRNNGQGGFSERIVITDLIERQWEVVATDLDNDGDNDIVIALEYDDQVVWYRNDGNGNFSERNIITSSANGAYGIYTSDLDGDGDEDVLSASLVDDKIAWYENLGDGTFGTQQVISSNEEGAITVYAEDLDGDGDNDVIAGSFYGYDNILAWFENDGQGGFGSRNIISLNNTGIKKVAASDLDGDEDMDVVAINGATTSRITWYENDGFGDLGDQQVITTPVPGGNGLHVTDMDGDGDPDVVASLVDDDRVLWFENGGNGIFSEPKTITTALDGAFSVFAVDLDGDGVKDVVASASNGRSIVWYKGSLTEN